MVCSLCPRAWSSRERDTKGKAAKNLRMVRRSQSYRGIIASLGNKVFTKSRPDSSKGKGGGKGKIDRVCFRCGIIGHFTTDCKTKTLINGGSPKSATQGKSVGNCEDEGTETSQHVPMETIDMGSFEVLSDHGDEVDTDEPTFETTEMMSPLPPDSWFMRTETFCGKFRKPCNEDHQDEEYPFLDCWDGKQEHFDAKWILGHETHQSLNPM